MVETKLEQVVKEMIAFKRITSPTGAISDRSKRKLEKASREVYQRLKDRQGIHEDAIVTANLYWEDEEKAKGYALGVMEFEQKYPEYGKILCEIIAQHRKVRRTHVQFGLVSGKDLPPEFYIEIIRGLGKEFTQEKAERLYQSLSEFWDKLGRQKEEGKYYILLPE